MSRERKAQNLPVIVNFKLCIVGTAPHSGESVAVLAVNDDILLAVSQTRADEKDEPKP